MTCSGVLAAGPRGGMTNRRVLMLIRYRLAVIVAHRSLARRARRLGVVSLPPPSIERRVAGDPGGGRRR